MEGLRGVKGRAGGILGGAPPPAIYNLPAQPAVSFPKAPSFDISSLFAPQTPQAPKKDAVAEWYKEHAGAGYMPRRWEVQKMLSRAQIGKLSPATGVQPYVYRGGEVELGAATKAPWATPSKKEEVSYMPAARLPAAIGVSTALSYARGMAGVSSAGKQLPKKKEIK